MTPQEFLEQVQQFRAVTPKEAKELLQSQGTILFIGRETCPYCRRFCQTLASFQKKYKQTIYFLHSQSPDYSSTEIATLRDQYHVATVPGLLFVAKDGVRVHCDSSMTLDEICSFTSLEKH